MRIIHQRKCKKPTGIFKINRPGAYQINESDSDKKFVNAVLSLFMSNVVGNIIILDNIKMLTTKALIASGIKPDMITAVEYNKSVASEMDRSLGANIVFGKIEEYIDNSHIQKIGGVYFDFTGNHVSLEMFEKGIWALSKHKTPRRIKIATTFSIGRRGKLCISELYNKSLNIMRKAFPNFCVIPQIYHTYQRYRSAFTMYHQQYILQKKININE
jgi:hypothetical protein